MSERPRERVVVVTQAEGRGRDLLSTLKSGGIRPWLIPVVAHEPVAEKQAIDGALERLGEFDWVLFTSAGAVDPICGRPAWKRWPWESAPRPRIGVVGTSTEAALIHRGIRVALCPATAGAASLAQAVIQSEGGTLRGRAVLWPRSEIARPELGDALRAAGGRVVDPVVYRTTSVTPPDVTAFVDQLNAGRIDAVTFLSPSSATGLAAVLPGGTLSTLAGRTIVASIGPTTSAALSDLGARPVIEAVERSGSGLAAALLNYLDQHLGVMP